MFNLNVSGRFAGVWKRAAAKKIQQQETAREFWGLIAGFVLLRVVTSFVSIFSGFAFFNVNFAGLIDNATARIIAAVSLLAVIEVITAAFLFKFFKFVYCFKWSSAAAMFLGVCLFFSISFYTSTRGIALYKSDTTEQAATLEQANAAAVDSVRAYYAGQIEIIRTNIESITPPRWNVDANGNATLTTEQQRTKTELYAKILALQGEQAAAIKEQRQRHETDKQSITAAAEIDGNKYAGYVCAIMILQLIANGVLCFLYSRIYHENNRADEVAAEIKNFAAGIATDTDNIIKSQISEQYGNYLDSMQRNLIALRARGNEPTANPPTKEPGTDTPNPAAVPVPNEQPPEPTRKHPQKITIRGFGSNTDNEQPNEHPAARITKPVYEQPNEQPNQTGVTIGDGWKYCELCGKPYQPRHARQKYCCEPCKFQACANRNGKQYTFNGVIYSPRPN